MIDFLNEIMENENISHSKLAKDTDLSRTYIVQVLSGKKPLSENFLKKILSLDYIADKYGEEMKELFFQETIGKKHFEFVKFFLKTGSEFTFDANASALPDKIETDDNPIKFSDKTELISLACKLLKKSCEKRTPFYSNYSFSQKELDEALYYIYTVYHKGENQTLHHLIYVNTSVDKNGILSYWSALRWTGRTQLPVKFITKSPATAPLPYYIVSGNTVIQFSADLNSSIILKDEKSSEFFINQHITAEKKADNPIKIIHNESDLLLNSEYIQNENIRSIRMVICPSNIENYDIYSRNTTNKIPNGFKDMLIKAVLNYYDNIKKSSNTCTYYVAGTIKDWAENGILYTISPKYLKPFNKEDRITVIRNILKNQCSTILKNENIKFEKGYSASVTDKKFITHLILTDSDYSDYEIYMEIDKYKTAGMGMLLDNIFKYFDLSFNSYTKAEAEFKLNQLCLMIN